MRLSVEDLHGDDIVRLREEKGVTETEFREAIRRRDEMPAELKTRALGAVNLIYALPRGSDYWSVKQQIILTCDNKETIRGSQRNLRDHQFHNGEDIRWQRRRLSD